MNSPVFNTTRTRTSYDNLKLTNIVFYFCTVKYCKTRKFHLQLTFTISADEAYQQKLKASKIFYFSNDIEEQCH